MICYFMVHVAYCLPRFMHRHCDSDLLHLYETCVPPVDLAKVSVFYGHVQKFKSKVGLTAFILATCLHVLGS